MLDNYLTKLMVPTLQGHVAYSLIGVAYYTGGHYKAFVCRSNVWYECEDSNVLATTWESVLKQKLGKLFLYKQQ